MIGGRAAAGLRTGPRQSAAAAASDVVHGSSSPANESANSALAYIGNRSFTSGGTDGAIRRANLQPASEGVLEGLVHRYGGHAQGNSRGNQRKGLATIASR